ncbi:hypothetical protein [Thiolapillus sp.]|uniref:hypothetical protein n=1 Tax=Thiolapillus sp. TaxID=2017437 RepID=UPI003AF4781D
MRVTCTPAHYAHICNPAPSRSPGHLRAWMLARLRLDAGTPAPGCWHACAWMLARLRLDAGTLTRSPGISALRLGLLRRYVHLAALSYCELCLAARTRAVIQRIRTD